MFTRNTHTHRVRKAYRFDRSVSRSDYRWMIAKAKAWDRDDRIHPKDY